VLKAGDITVTVSCDKLFYWNTLLLYICFCGTAILLEHTITAHHCYCTCQFATIVIGISIWI